MKIIAPAISCLIHADVEGEENGEFQKAVAEGYTQIYIQTPEGTFKHHIFRSGREGIERFIRIPVTEVPGLKFKEYKPGVNFLPDGKIPQKFLEEVKAFFKEVIRVKGTAVEAMIWILWNSEKGYFLHVPNQIVSKASASYDWSGLPPNSSIIVDIHSHADFGAFFSGTDNADDSNTIRYSGVIGNNTSPQQSYKWRFNYYDKKYDLEMHHIFEIEEKPLPEIPKSWVDAVDMKTYKGKGGKNSGMPSHIAGMTHGGNVVHPGQHVFGFGDSNDLPGAFPGGENPSKKEHFGPQRTPLVTGANTDTNNTSNRRAMPGRVTLGGKTFLDTGNGLVEIKTRGHGNWKEERDKAIQKEEEKVLSGMIGTNVSHGAESIDRGIVLAGAAASFGNPEETESELNDFLPGNVESRFHRLSYANSHGSVEETEDQETVLSEQAEAYLVKLDQAYGAAKSVSSREIDDSGRSANDLSVDNLSLADLPPEFDDIAVSHGIAAAKSFAVIDRASTDLIGKDRVLDQTIEALFNLVEDDNKLATFRILYGLLPSNARDNLAQNGI